MFPYSSLVVYAVVSVATSFLVTTFRFSIWILDGLHTYIHPENVGNGDQGNARAVIRRPEAEKDSNTICQDASSGRASGNGTVTDNSANTDVSERGSMGSVENPQQNPKSSKETYSHVKGKGKSKERVKVDPLKSSRRKKDKMKEKFEFDETNAQIFRLRLGDCQLHSRQYFSEYDEAVTYSSLGLSNLLIHQFLPACLPSDDKQAATTFFRGDLIPLIVGLFAVYKLSRLLGSISLERSASKNSDRLLSVFAGLLGFLVAFSTLSVFVPDVVDLRFGITSTAESEENDGIQMGFQFGFIKLLLALFAGWLSGLLFSPAHKSVRSFWLGTDQLQWNLTVIGSGKVTRTLFYLSIVMPIFTSLLWIKPLADIFILQSPRNQSIINNKPRAFPFDTEDHRGIQQDTIFSDVLKEENVEVDNVGGLEDFGHQYKVSMCSESNKDLDVSESLLSQCDHAFQQRQNSWVSSHVKSQDLIMDSPNVKTVYVEGEDPKWNFWRRFYSSYEENWTCEIGMPSGTFENFRLWCLLLTGILQLLLLRPNLQMYLNEAVLIWYQRLHSSKVPNLDFSRAKLFLHNYFLCQVALQFLIPGILILLFLGLSQTCGSIFGGLSLPESFPFSSSLVQEAALFMAWWVQSAWAVLTCSNLVLYRLGFLMVS